MKVMDPDQREQRGRESHGCAQQQAELRKMEALAAKERERQEAAERANDRRVVAAHEAAQQETTVRVAEELFFCAPKSYLLRRVDPCVKGR